MRAILKLVLLLSAGVIGCAVDAQTLPVEIIALRGAPAFDLPGERFLSLRPPSAPQSGVVVFSASTNADGNAQQRLFRWTSQHGSLLAREGDPLGGHPGLVYKSFSTPILAESGHVTFLSTYGNGSKDRAVISGPTDDLRLIALARSEDDPYWDYLEGLINLDNFSVAPTGVVGIEASPEAIPNYWSGPPQSLSHIFGPDTPIDGLDTDVTFDRLARSSMNGAGGIIGHGKLQGGGYANSDALVYADATGARLVAAVGNPAPGTNGQFAVTIRTPSTNRHGTIGFRGRFTEDGSTTLDGIWTGKPGAIDLLIKEGDPAPNLPGYSIDWLSSPSVDDSEAITIWGGASDLFGDTTQGVWRFEDSRPTDLLVSIGDEIDNLNDATLERFTDGGSGPITAAVNTQGHFAFLGYIELANAQKRTSLLVSPEPGVLLSIATVGELFELVPDDNRVVSEISLHRGTSIINDQFAMNGADGEGSFLNDLGVLTLSLVFDDGSQALIVTTIPAPPTLLAFAFLALTRRHRR